MELAIMGRMPDCHWTSLNFFNHYARQYFLDTRLAADHVLNSYDRVAPPYEFGDVLMFLDAHGQAIHSCVYLADDIVYTKNGENLVSPWLLMKLDDVKSIYFPVNEGSVQGFRIKARPERAPSSLLLWCQRDNIVLERGMLTCHGTHSARIGIIGIGFDLLPLFLRALREFKDSSQAR